MLIYRTVLKYTSQLNKLPHFEKYLPHYSGPILYTPLIQHNILLTHDVIQPQVYYTFP